MTIIESRKANLKKQIKTFKKDIKAIKKQEKEVLQKKKMKISKIEFIKVLKILADKIDFQFETDIEIVKEDFYWVIDESEIFNPTENPSDLTLGQLSDDWKSLLRLLNEDKIPLSFDLIRLSYLLLAIRKNSIGKW